MKKTKSFIPSAETNRVTWLNNLAAKIGAYAAKYGLTAAEVTDIVNAAVYYSFWVNYANQVAEYSKKVNAWKVELQKGVKKGTAASIPPSPPALGTVPTAVAPGIFNRISSIVQIIKNRSVYTVADGKDLGIEATEASTDNLMAAKPTIKLQRTNSGKVEIVWKKGKYQGVKIEVDRGKGFEFLVFDTSPNHIDNNAFPATAALWKYRAIYMLHDEAVGNWSDTAVIAVGE